MKEAVTFPRYYVLKEPEGIPINRIYRLLNFYWTLDLPLKILSKESTGSIHSRKLSSKSYSNFFPGRHRKMSSNWPLGPHCTIRDNQLSHSSMSSSFGTSAKPLLETQRPCFQARHAPLTDATLFHCLRFKFQFCHQATLFEDVVTVAL